MHTATVQVCLELKKWVMHIPHSSQQQFINKRECRRNWNRTRNSWLCGVECNLSKKMNKKYNRYKHKMKKEKTEIHSVYWKYSCLASIEIILHKQQFHHSILSVFTSNHLRFTSLHSLVWVTLLDNCTKSWWRRSRSNHTDLFHSIFVQDLCMWSWRWTFRH